MAIDVALKVRGCVVISACSLCGVTTEDSDKLFLLCPFARVLWEWLQEIAHLNLDCSSLVSLLNSVGTRNRSQQVKEVLISTIVHILWVIWFCRNSLRFRDTKISLSQGQIMVVFSVSLSGFLASRSTSNSITEFTILKTFKVDARPPTIILAIEHAFFVGLSKLWLECDSTLVLKAFKNPHLVTWEIRSHWNRCVTLTSWMFFQISHIFREGANKIVNFGIEHRLELTW
ncbi:hypothetical protein GmHk_10G028285 [Glycine max]|nr:hypothetical protein GmHk_10G028285 [Glycine max]